MTNSSLYINHQDLVICEGRVSLISNSQLVATYGEIIITENSVVVFTEFNTTAHGIIFNGTIVKLENSTLSLTKTTNIWNNTWFIVSSEVDINAGSSIIISKNSDSTYHLESTILKIHTSNITLTGAKLLIENNECETFDGGSGVLETWNTTMKLTEGSSVIITHNKAVRATISKISKGLVEIIDSTMAITQNTIIGSKGCVYSQSSVILSGGELVLEENECTDYYSKLLFLWKTSFKQDLSGSVVISHNNITDGGVLSITSSTAWFNGSVEATGNRAAQGAISATDSDLFITGIATFSDNEAANGGAVTLISSVMYVSPTATVNFTRNHAKGVGGAIYVHNARTTNVCINSLTKTLPCSIQVLQENQFEFCPSFVLHFDENKADIACNIIYGDYTSACTPRNVSNVLNCNCNITLALDHYQYKNGSSDLSDFTSDPTRVCFCTILGVVNCFRVRQILTLYPGESFYLSLALVGYGMGTVPGSVVARSSNGKGTVNGRSILGSELEYSQEIKGTECQDLRYSIVSERHSEVIALTVDSVSSIRSLEHVMMVSSIVKGYNGFWPTHEIFGTFSVLESFFHIPVFVEVDLLACPVGFQLVRGRSPRRGRSP